MKLSELLTYIGEEGAATVGNDPDITSLHYRSQDVTPGGLFVAMRGQAADGHDYIDDAFSRGAAAVVAQKQVPDDERIVLVADSRLALAGLAAAFYGDPSAHLTLVGVTGTNGKTTVTYLLEAILEAADLSAGVIGTNNCRYGRRVIDSKVTTPESLDLQRMLADMRAEGVSHVVMEVSSHGIDLGRVAFGRFDVGAFTNLTQDHLDFHQSMDSYWECKQRFFTRHLSRGPKADSAVAVINTDNANGRELRNSLRALDSSPRVITYGRDEENDVSASNVTMDLSGIRGNVMTADGSVALYSRLVGEHNLENILCAVAVAQALKLPLAVVEQGIGAMSRIPGRLERVDDTQGRMVFVDYAHTPDALENVLQTLQGISRRRLICVFGCGGDRDRKKRPLMGKIAGRLCDYVVVTADNPRTESPDGIIADILPGVREEMALEIKPGNPAGRGYVVIPDRAEAIRGAIRMAEPEDVVLIAGKGHETYQIIGKKKRDFDDRRVAAEALANTVGEQGVQGHG